MAIVKKRMDSDYYNEILNAAKFFIDINASEESLQGAVRLIRLAYEDILKYSHVRGFDIPEDEENGRPEVVQFRTTEDFYAFAFHCWCDYSDLAAVSGYTHDYAKDLIASYYEYKQAKANQAQARNLALWEKYKEFEKTGYNGKFTKKAFAEKYGFPYYLVIQVTNEMEALADSSDGSKDADE